MGNFECDNKNLVVTDWDKMKECIFATKDWVSNNDVNTKTSYEKGDFLRIWCEYDGNWCSERVGHEDCYKYIEYKKS